MTSAPLGPLFFGHDYTRDMPSRVTFDFSRHATLSHILTGTAEFNATAELGRATATVGAANAATRVAAGQLGTYANGATFLVWSAGGSVERVERDGRQLRVGKRTGGTALQLAAAINNMADDPRVYRSVELADAITQALRGNHPSPDAKTLPRLDIGADNAGGTGADAAATGLGTLAGGVDSTLAGPNHHEYGAAAGNGGLFVFDHSEPLVLVQLAAYLSGSAAWTLTLRPLTPARGDLGTPVAVAGATSATALVLDKPVVIPPGWGLGFAAAAVQGRVYATVRRA